MCACERFGKVKVQTSAATTRYQKISVNVIRWSKTTWCSLKAPELELRPWKSQILTASHKCRRWCWLVHFVWGRKVMRWRASKSTAELVETKINSLFCTVDLRESAMWAWTHLCRLPHVSCFDEGNCVSWDLRKYKCFGLVNNICYSQLKPSTCTHSTQSLLFFSHLH